MTAPLPRPDLLAEDDLSPEEARTRLRTLSHPRPEAWLESKIRDGKVRVGGEPARIRTDDLWRELLTDECDKLLNQAFCALRQIREAEDGTDVTRLALDDLPTPVEQAVSLAPSLAREHLELLGSYRQEKRAQLEAELGLGSDRETAERIECLAFWEANGPDLTPLRLALFRAVRESLAHPA